MDLDHLDLGYDIPARPGMAEGEVQTPCLVLDLDALERNIRKMGDFAREHGMRHRVHGKMHRSVDVARLQMRRGGAAGVCCQKVSEAEVFVRGGIKDVLVSNEVRDPLKIDRLARLPLHGAKVSVCVDDIDNVAEISEAAQRHGTALGVLIELDCGAGRCGVTCPGEVTRLARAIDAAPALTFAGVQAYHGGLQHIEDPADRETAFEGVLALLRPTLAALEDAGLEASLVTGGGTGSYRLETASGLYTELQCGSYAFMDADYGRIRTPEGRLDAEWENALFVLAQVMSKRPGRAVCDAGLKAVATDSGLPVPLAPGLRYTRASDEHGELDDPEDTLRPGDKLRLIPGHCDPTVNLHDWFVGLRGGRVECLWPVSARGKGF